MSLDLLAVQDSIVTKLNELPQNIYETTAPEDSKLPFDAAGIMLPYIVVEFSDMYESTGAAGIVSSAYDVKTSYIIVSCIGPTQRSSRQVAQAVRQKLTGYVPVNAGEMILAGGGQAYTTVNQKVSRYISQVAFTFQVNTVW
jgi:hypothetical protein